MVSKLPPLTESFLETLDDKIFLIVFIAALISIAFGEWEDF